MYRRLSFISRVCIKHAISPSAVIPVLGVTMHSSPSDLLCGFVYTVFFAFSPCVCVWDEIRELQHSDGHFLLQQILVMSHRHITLNRSVRKS